MRHAKLKPWGSGGRSQGLRSLRVVVGGGGREGGCNEVWRLSQAVEPEVGDVGGVGGGDGGMVQSWQTGISVLLVLVAGV